MTCSGSFSVPHFFRCRRRNAEVSAAESKQLLKQLLPSVSLLEGKTMGDVSVCARVCVCRTQRGMEKRHMRLLRTDAGRFLRPGNALLFFSYFRLLWSSA